MPEKVAEYIALPSPERRVPEVCERTQRLYEEGRTVAIYAPDASLAAELDTALWTFQQQSFIPHVRLEEADEPLLEPVVIFSDERGDPAAGVLFIVTDEPLPPWFTHFGHIYDFAPTYAEEPRQAARERFAACKEAGYRMRFIKADG